MSLLILRGAEGGREMDVATLSSFMRANDTGSCCFSDAASRSKNRAPQVNIRGIFSEFDSRPRFFFLFNILSFSNPKMFIIQENKWNIRSKNREP